MQKLYKIESPDIAHIQPADFFPYVMDSTTNMALAKAVAKTYAPEYLHWKDIKYKSWIPEPLKEKKEIFWRIVKFYRHMKKTPTPILDAAGHIFSWEKLAHYDAIFHGIDMDMSKYLLNFPDISPADRQKYQRNGIIEEAIASSQLEGAQTTRKVAKQMIEEKRKPRTHAEKMIQNNYVAMRSIQEKFKDEKLSLDVLFELHRMLTEDTMDESERGRFRDASDQIVIQKGDDPSVISYVAPPIDFVVQEMEKFIDFANDELETGYFIHPIIKAIMLHFWMGLLHPFIDGNGRMARGLFYWYLLRKGYWAFAFLPISIAIKSAPAQYSEAYVLSEQDDNDLTYFIDYHIRKINQAIESFKHYITHKTAENRRIDHMLAAQKNLNRRQVEVLMNLRKNPDMRVNVTAYVNQYEVTKATAISDLKKLVAMDYLEPNRHGKNVFYLPTRKLQALE